MSFLNRIKATRVNNPLKNQAMDLEMEDCASYQNFYSNIKDASKSTLSSSQMNVDSSDSSDESDDGWNQSDFASEEDDDFEIVFADEFPGENRASESNSLQALSSCLDEIMDETESEAESEDDESLELSEIILKVNREWNKANEDIDGDVRPPTKVSFAPDESLVQTFPADICERKGEWEMYAVDRMRFKKRIDDTEAIISHCFSKEHRTKISLRFESDF